MALPLQSSLEEVQKRQDFVVHGERKVVGEIFAADSARSLRPQVDQEERHFGDFIDRRGNGRGFLEAVAGPGKPGVRRYRSCLRRDETVRSVLDRY